MKQTAKTTPTSAGIIRAVIAPHTPRMGIAERAPQFVRGLIEAAQTLGADLRALKPDVLIVHSAHWVNTFNWHVTCQPEHRGVCVSSEAPNIISGMPYHWPGDPVFARALVDAINAAGHPCEATISPNFVWDYGSWVPTHYIDPNGQIPVVLIGTCALSTLDECMHVGRAIRIAAKKSRRRAIFVASTALSHKLVRGPEHWPTKERQEADMKLIDMLTHGRIAEAKAWLPHYADFAVGEVGGRNIATLLGCLNGSTCGTQIGPYGQSSGSGNAHVVLQSAA